MPSVKVDVDLSNTKADLKGKMKRGQYALANQALQDMNRYVPKKSVDLRNTGTIGMDGKTILWNTVYAKAQFYGTNGKAVFHNYTTPGTGSRWDNKAQSIHSSQWSNIVGRAMQ